MFIFTNTTRVDAFDLLCGSFILMSFGADMVDAIIKNSSSRNIMSVIDDMLKPASILLLFFRAMLVLFFVV